VLGQVFLTIIILIFLCGIGSITMSLITENKYQQPEIKPVIQKKVVQSQYETSVDNNNKSASVFIDDYDYDDILED